MYKAILVDDEELVCKGLKNYFDWSRFNIEVIADLPDGQKAYDFVKENPIDLLVTDVKMPYMDGIELAKNVQELYPDVKIIFVSGYDDVNYLKTAFKVDAVDYILKSIDLEELKETVGRVVSKMDEENRRKKSFSDMEKALSQSIPILKERLLTTLIRDDIDDPDIIRERIQFLNLPLNDEVSCCVLVLRIERNYGEFFGMSERERQLKALEIQNECVEIGKQHGETICFESRQGEYAIILSLFEDEFEETLLSVAGRLRKVLKDRLDISVSIGISGKFKGLRNIKNAYESASNAISKRYLLDDALAISIDKYETDESLKDYKEKAEKSLLEALSCGNTQQVRDLLAELFNGMMEKFHYDDQQNLMIYLLLLPARIITDVKIRKKSVYSDQRAILEQFLCCKDLHEQCLLTGKLYDEVALIMNSLSKTHSQSIIEHVRKNIDENCKSQISITSLAEDVYLTPTYLCVLFKQATGSTINEYLTTTRLEKAKKLLADSHFKLYDICYEVGYLSPSYFSRLFKKYVGISPSEYRNIALSNAEG